MTDRWMTKKDIASAIRAQNIFNSRVKRGEIDVKNILSTRYVVCGCGEEGCGFLSIVKKDD
jgi:hypothetical protein